MITCEAGVLLDEILRLVLPKGWMFKVTPGTRLITVGGAIASDVHGKNHFHAGCFSDHLLSFDLMRADGQVVVRTPTQNADLFWQTSGGMGWTGVILRATFQLMKIPSGRDAPNDRAWRELEAVMEQFYRYENSTYMAGWIDCLASGKNLGRGVAFFAEHADEPDLSVRAAH